MRLTSVEVTAFGFPQVRLILPDRGLFQRTSRLRKSGNDIGNQDELNFFASNGLEKSLGPNVKSILENFREDLVNPSFDLLMTIACAEV